MLIWWALFLLCLMPLVNVLIKIFFDGLGSDPAKELVLLLGETSITFVVITLSVTPLAKYTRKRRLVKFRRMLGLYCLFYATLHLFAYWWFLADPDNRLQDLVKRPYIMLGALSYLILVILGVTSPKKMMKYLGKRWKQIHKGIYVAALLAVMHFFWLTRSDYARPVIYGGVILLLLLLRVNWVQFKLSGRLANKL